MKHAIVLVIAAALLWTAAGAAAQELGGQLTFAQAVELMYANNTAIKIAELNWEIAQLDYEKAVASNLMSGSQQSAMQAEHTLARAKNTYHSSLQNSYLELLRAYTDVLAAAQSVTVRELELTVAEHNYAVVKEQVRIGDAGKLDELSEMNRLEAARRNADSAKRALAEKERALRRLLGLTGDTPLNLAFDFGLPKLSLTLDECLEIGLENSTALWDQKQSLELQERQLETARISGTPPLDLKRSELNLEIARLNLESQEAEIVESITSAYYALADALSRYESAEREWQIAQETYDIYKRQAEAGLITDIQLLQQQISFLNAQSSLQDAHVSYLVSYIQFHQSLGLDGTVQ